MSKGWIKLHRQIMDHPFYTESRVFSRHEAWEYLLLSANHSDNKTMIDGKLVVIERGSFITSIRKLQERWRWSNTKVCRFLDVLECEGMIFKKNDTKKTLISIDKYGFYQGEGDEKTTVKRRENDAETTQKHTNKNVKNLKNDKNDKNNPPFIPPEGKIQFADMVFLSQEEADKIISDNGESEFDYWVAALSDYQVENKNRPSKIKSDHYRTILNWIRTDHRRKGQAGTRPASKGSRASARDMAEQLKREQEGKRQ